MARIRDKAKQREYARRHYERNRELMVARAVAHNAKTRAAVREFVADYLASHPCIDCGEADPVVLEFDHRDPSTKQFNVGDASKGARSVRVVAMEIAKCDVRCANCHRRRTHKQRAGMRG